jgi:YD repeat-containing protein
VPVKVKLTKLVVLAAGFLSLAAVTNISHARTTTYIYDDLDRLKEADLPDGRAMVYSYDELGNLVGKTSGLSLCPVGYYFNPNDNLCEKDPCPIGYQIDTSTNMCESSSDTSYPSSCQIGSYNYLTSRCETPATTTATNIGGATIPVYVSAACFLPASGGVCYLGISGYYQTWEQAVAGYLFPQDDPHADIPVYTYDSALTLIPFGTPIGYLSSQGFTGSRNVDGLDYVVDARQYLYLTTNSGAFVGYMGGGYKAGSMQIRSCPVGTLDDTTCWVMPTCPNGGVLQGAMCVKDALAQVSPSCSFDPVTHKCYVIPAAIVARDIAINGKTANTNSASVALALSCTAKTGSCGQMQFSNDNTNWSSPEPYSASKNWTLSSGDGTKYVYVKFTDSTGIWSPALRSSIFLDTTLPVTTASPAGGTFTTGQTVTLACNDGAGSGCNKIYYTTDGTTPTTASSIYTAPLSIASSLTLNYFATDLAGNSEAAKSQTYTICTGPHVKIAGKSSYDTLQDAYNAAVDGDTIQAQAVVFSGNLTANRDISITLDGGYSCDFLSKSGITTLRGAMTINSGTVNGKDFFVTY